MFVLLYREKPRCFFAAPRFKSLDLVHVLQREADVIESVQQAVLAENVDLKFEYHA
jgi:hypothetical protein